jgi:hypothetical protein
MSLSQYNENPGDTSMYQLAGPFLPQDDIDDNSSARKGTTRLSLPYEESESPTNMDHNSDPMTLLLD